MASRSEAARKCFPPSAIARLMARYLVTGADGFIGSRLALELLDEGRDVVATLLNESSRYEPVPAEHAVHLDVTDALATYRLLTERRPDVIYHLAAQSNPVVSWQRPAETLRINALGTVHLLEAVRAAGVPARVFLACSSAEYGFGTVPGRLITEDDRLLPVHPYGLSKVAQDFLGLEYFRTYGLATIRGRIFNTIGPRKVADAPSDFARQVVAVEAGRQPSVRVGNLDAIRDFSDVRDMIRMIRSITEHGRPGEVYNLCTGRATVVRDLLNDFVAHAKRPVRIEHDPARNRPSDEPWIVGDNRRLREAIDWAPTTPLTETTQQILDYWRQAGG